MKNPNGHTIKPFNPKTIEWKRDYARETRRKRDTEVIPARQAKLHEAIKSYEVALSIPFIAQSEINITESEGLSNQLIVCYKNGIFDILPKGIVGAKVETYLGVRFSRIFYWAMLPVPFGENNHIPLKYGGHGLHDPRDIYNEKFFK